MDVSLKLFEEYLTKRYKSWATEHGLFMKLVEEMGEVAEIVNMRLGYKQSTDVDLQKELGNELYDMLHYIVAIAAINDIDLASILLEKDKISSAKYGHNINFEQYVTEKRNK